MEDDEIRAALRRGDAALAFRLLQDAHGEAIFTRCSRILKDRSAAEDVMQLVMMAAYDNRRELRKVDNLRGWLIQVASRRCVDLLRSADRRRRHERHAATGDPAETESLLELLGTTERLGELVECLAALDPDLALAVNLRHLDGMSWVQVAEVMGTSVDKIRMRVQRGAMRSLRDCLASKEIVP